MLTYIDLDAIFGRRFRVCYEKSYRAERGEDGRRRDPWLLTIPCRHGHIYPHGGQDLAASTTHRGPIAGRLAALPCVRVVQDGDDGVNVVFNVADFDQVAATSTDCVQSLFRSKSSQVTLPKGSGLTTPEMTHGGRTTLVLSIQPS